MPGLEARLSAVQRLAVWMPPLGWAVVAAFVVCSAAVFRYGTDFMDEGLLYQHGVRILAGDLPYRDFYIMQAPGTFYVEALLIKLFGVSMIVGRLFKQAQGLFVLFLIYRLVVAASGNRRVAVGVMAVAAAWSSALHMRFHWYTTDAAILVLAAAYCLVLFIRSDRLTWLSVAGLCLGGAVMFKQNLGLIGWASTMLLCGGTPLIARVWSSGPPLDIGRILRQMAVLTVSVAVPVALFLLYYASAGGRLQDIWALTVVAPQRSYEMQSPWGTLIHPFRVLLLVPHRGLATYTAMVAFFAAIPLLVMRTRHPWSARSLALLVLAAVAAWDVGIFARIVVYPVTLAVFALTIGLAVRGYLAAPDDATVACRLWLAVFAFFNLYGGLVTGGGWGRYTGLMVGSLYVTGVLADLIVSSPVIRDWWDRRLWCSCGLALRSATVAAVVFGLLMLVDNRSFRPWIDFPLYRLSRSMTVEGAAGIIGYGPFVEDTDAVVRHVKASLDDAASREIFVFPVNPMIYPLASATNSTTFDTLQKNPFVPELIPELLRQLRANPPQLVVMQKRANHTLAPPLESEAVWVVEESVPAVCGFLSEHRYRKEFDSEFYEVYHLGPSAAATGVSTASGLEGAVL